MIVELSSNSTTKTIVELSSNSNTKSITLMEEEDEATTHIDQSQQTSLMSNATDIIGGERTNFAEKEEEVSLLMVCHVKDETQQNMWYLDNGCSNHMCGDKKAFYELDELFRTTIKFGDNSTIYVMGKGRVTIQTKENSTHTISNALYVPNLKTNLLSVGQLQEKGYAISIKDGVCQIQDAKLGLIAQVNMTTN
ncbi:uncharacterized protein LOC133824638 [Humulus lupulus]|uniref:uncharacterized protein LOC133824638 n=1 Tax=Humulus lupulus TaxID=3486 RepID=UPI002B400F11|nr:uncharacterized protein LOC133824638 [Humulus lupulus]